MATYKNYKISAEVQLYDWYNVDDSGALTTTQGELIDASSMKVVQYNVYNRDTLDEHWLDADDYQYVDVLTYIDGLQHG